MKGGEGREGREKGWRPNAGDTSGRGRERRGSRHEEGLACGACGGPDDDGDGPGSLEAGPPSEPPPPGPEWPGAAWPQPEPEWPRP